MEQEKIVKITSAYSINIANNAVTSLRINNDKKTTYRVYENGQVGIAGGVGIVDEDSLLTTAKQNLKHGIPYPCDLTENTVMNVDAKKEIIAPEKFVETVRHLVDRLAKEFPDFIFSNKINLNEQAITYSNSKQTQLSFTGNALDLSVVIKAKSSANIMDLAYGSTCFFYDEDKIVGDVAKLLDVYQTNVDFPEGDLPVIISVSSVLNLFASELIAEKYMSGAGLLKDKLGKETFNDQFSLVIDRTVGNEKNVCFFDGEGVVSKKPFNLVKNGVLTGLLTYKRSASNYSLPLMGSAEGEYDEVPSVTFNGWRAENTAETLGKLVKDRAIYVCMTSGGDMTPSGEVGLPVMLAYLYEGGKLVGKLPEFSLSGNLYDILGKNFVGITQEGLFEHDNTQLLVTHFQLNR